MCFSRAAGFKSQISQTYPDCCCSPEEIDADFRGNSKDIFSGLNEILEAGAALEECLSTVNLLMSEDR